MSRALSSYLEVVRLCAALMVFAYHASNARFGGGWIGPLGGYGHEAVLVFFVLSGFVIAFSEEIKDHTAPQYAASRLSRLWSVAVPAILLTFLMDAVGKDLSPGLYESVCRSSGLDLIAPFVFLNQIWFVDGCVGSNLSYWSLCYEFLYYLAFAVFTFTQFRWLALALVALVAGPKVLLLAPCWAAGVFAYRLSKRQLPRPQSWLLAVGALALFLAMVVFRIGNEFVDWRYAELIGPRWSKSLGHSAGFVSDYVVTGLFALHLIGMANLLRAVPVSPVLSRLLKNAASTTYGIYLLHYPGLMIFTAICVHVTGAIDGMLVGLASLTVPVLLTPLTEAFKGRLRQLMLGMLQRRALAGF